MKIYDIMVIQRNNNKLYLVELDEHDKIDTVSFMVNENNVLIKVKISYLDGTEKTLERISKQYKELFKEVLFKEVVFKHLS